MNNVDKITVGTGGNVPSNNKLGYAKASPSFKKIDPEEEEISNEDKQKSIAENIINDEEVED